MIDLKKTVLGIEFGSTRIKAVLIDREHRVLAQGSKEWENQLINGIWTYSMDDIHEGLQSCYADLKKNILEKYGIVPDTYGAMGVSGMMHGYLPFDKNDVQLAGFRTWRNTMTGEAAKELTSAFCFNIPQRWSIAHLYQAVLNREDHVSRIARLTTLAGQVHYELTGKHVMGIGEASGMFPIDSTTMNYDSAMMEKFDAMHDMPWKLADILPEVLTAGEDAGSLTAEGARLLDPAGDLIPGIPFAPCEGDAGTGMTATDSVRVRTGNVSAGTSDFAMIVTEKAPGVHREIDMVTTPTGKPVAMVHCNNCTSDINAWVNLLYEFSQKLGAQIDKGELYLMLFREALKGDPDCGGLLSYNYFSGEGVTDLDAGRPVFLRLPDAKLTLPNFMRTHILSALSTLKIGLDILTCEEKVPIDKLYGHGGLFKTPEVGQRLLSAAVGAPVSIMETAGEGGPYGMALLAGYMLWKDEHETLEDYLDHKVFRSASTVTLMADQSDIDGFNAFLKRYTETFSVEKAAVAYLHES